MSDFSELCPLFNTGVYSEVTFGYQTFSSISTTMNALGGLVNSTTKPASFKFNRTVVVTSVWCQRIVTCGSSSIILAERRASSGSAAQTAFASLVVSTTVTTHPKGAWRQMTQASNKTFLAADVLGFAVKTQTATAGVLGFIVQYKEK